MDIRWAEANLENEALAKVNPPIRTTGDRAKLWEALLDGRVLTIGSDHAPHLLEEKDQGVRSPSGIPGVETMGPLLMSKVKRRELPLERFVQVLCSSPAKRFGLFRKGSISVGMDADIAVFDPSNERKVRAEDLHSRCGWTPYEGMQAIFPEAVYSRGERIVESSEATFRPGRGRNVRA
jgi:dihydroorotase